ncbi:hypothetical protein [Aquimarina longa]|nr:hypothetical protein [Aquimarina longa]
MKNLENLGVQNMNTEELNKTNGGGILLLPIIGFAWGYAYEKYIIQ